MEDDEDRAIFAGGRLKIALCLCIECGKGLVEKNRERQARGSAEEGRPEEIAPGMEDLVIVGRRHD